MRRLLPDPDPFVDPLEVYGADQRQPRRDRPWLVVNMITSADGATAVGGRSGPLGGTADRTIFNGLRALTDAILVGAGTARAENYGPPRIGEDAQRARIDRGQAAVPVLAVVSQSLVFDPDAHFFDTADGDPPVIITSASSDADRRTALAARAMVVVAGEERVDLVAAVRALGARGARVLLCEGGPTLNGDLLAAGVVDELCLTIAPCMAGGRSRRAIEGPILDDPVGLHVDRVLEEDGYLFVRYVVSAASALSASSTPTAG